MSSSEMLFTPFPRKPVADLRQLKSIHLNFIVEEILKRRDLFRYEYLNVLLPDETDSLNCDEITPFCPFDCLRTVKLITKRCPTFKMLHFHTYIESRRARKFANKALNEAIQGLKFLQEINFYDCWLSRSIIKSIALNCPNLRELYLHDTSIEDDDLKILLKKESVIKNSLTKLLIDETRIKEESIKQCLLNLQNLTYFQSDKTIQAALQLFETVKHSAEASDAIPKFKTTVFKNIFFRINKKLLTDDFLKWLGEKFPEVKYLNILLREEYNEFVSCLIISWKHITQLELTSLGKEETVSALIPAIVSCENLITLKLEKFWNLLLSVLSSKNIEKVFFCDQSSFISPLIKDLLERNCLRNLKELKVMRCFIGIDCIWELLRHAIPVTDIELWVGPRTVRLFRRIP
ncbi:hypothetical protein Avbf_06909 [Armadillidium vulgare]|nr:hypothetical protein Avbf_06909 [Armadillidium vulgare]